MVRMGLKGAAFAAVTPCFESARLKAAPQRNVRSPETQRALARGLRIFPYRTAKVYPTCVFGTSYTPKSQL